MGTRRTNDQDRLVEERLAMLLRPGPRHAHLPREEHRAPASSPAAAVDDDDTEISSDRVIVAAEPADIADGSAPVGSSDQDGQDEDGQDEDGQDEDGLPAHPYDPDADHAVGPPPVSGPSATGRFAGLFRLLPVGSFAGFGRPQLAVIAVIVALGVLFGGWAVLRARPVAVGAPRFTATAEAGGADGATATTSATHPSPTNPGSTTPSPSPAGGSASPEKSAAANTIRVHVLGAVHRPGVVSLSPTARVQDAIKKAGGTKQSARLGDLNLAQPLTDGQQVFVGHGKRDSEVRNPTSGPAPDSAAPGAAGQTSTGSAAAPPSGPVDLNTATLDQLDELPGVGPVTAQKILDWRSEHGKFNSVDELQEVDGIGPKTFADLKPGVTV